MKWSELGTSADAPTRALAIISDRWTLILLARCIAGDTRFDDLQRSHGLSKSIVSDRLKLLVREGILHRAPYTKRRHEYLLTEKGKALLPLFAAVDDWARTYYADGTADGARETNA